MELNYNQNMKPYLKDNDINTFLPDKNEVITVPAVTRRRTKAERHAIAANAIIQKLKDEWPIGLKITVGHQSFIRASDNWLRRGNAYDDVCMDELHEQFYLVDLLQIRKRIALEINNKRSMEGNERAVARRLLCQQKAKPVQLTPEQEELHYWKTVAQQQSAEIEKLYSLQRARANVQMVEPFNLIDIEQFSIGTFTA